jgi:hypothetical protein
LARAARRQRQEIGDLLNCHQRVTAEQIEHLIINATTSPLPTCAISTGHETTLARGEKQRDPQISM